MLIYKDEILNEPGNVDFGSADISGIGDGTVTGAISAVNSKRIQTERFTVTTSESGFAVIPIDYSKFAILSAIVVVGRYDSVDIMIYDSSYEAYVYNFINKSAEVNMSVTLEISYCLK